MGVKLRSLGLSALLPDCWFGKRCVRNHMHGSPDHKDSTVHPTYLPGRGDRTLGADREDRGSGVSVGPADKIAHVPAQWRRLISGSGVVGGGQGVVDVLVEGWRIRLAHRILGGMVNGDKLPVL